MSSFIMPRPVAGFRRQVIAVHPMFGPLRLLTTEASVSEALSPAFTRYAFTPGYGAKQKTIHMAGTKEISWTVGGDVTASSLGIVRLLASEARGVQFRNLLISQGTDYYFFDNPQGYTLPWNQITLNGNQNASLSFNIEGKSTFLPGQGPAPGVGEVDGPVPTWATGNDYVLTWSLSHNTNLTPFWLNDRYMMPAYYRAGESEFTIQLTMAARLQEHTLIKIGYGGVVLAEAVVTSRNRTFGDRNSPVTYQVSSTNVGIASQENAYNNFVGIVLNGVPPSSHYG